MNLLNKTLKNPLSLKINNPQVKYSHNMVYSNFPGYYDVTQLQQNSAQNIEAIIDELKADLGGVKLTIKEIKNQFQVRLANLDSRLNNLESKVESIQEKIDGISNTLMIIRQQFKNQSCLKMERNEIQNCYPSHSTQSIQCEIRSLPSSESQNSMIVLKKKSIGQKIKEYLSILAFI